MKHSAIGFVMGALAAMLLVSCATPSRGAVVFTENIKAAQAKATKENKIVMIDVYTEWCGWCKKLDADVYSRKDVADAVSKGFVALKVNPEKNAANKKFVDQFKVDGFPAIIFLNAKGKEIHRIRGYVPAPDFLKELKTAQSKAKG